MHCLPAFFYKYHLNRFYNYYFAKYIFKVCYMKRIYIKFTHSYLQTSGMEGHLDTYLGKSICKHSLFFAEVFNDCDQYQEWINSVNSTNSLDPVEALPTYLQSNSSSWFLFLPLVLLFCTFLLILIYCRFKSLLPSFSS